MRTGKYTLKELLTHDEVEQIIIPEIQRDYVWQEDNVKNLIDYITENWKKMVATDIAVQELAQPPIDIQGNIKEELKKVYQRHKFGSKIGFIYAYQDFEYNGKLFLIDGQQRLTTIYLLLLALHVRDKKESDFITKYYYKKSLKLDYKIREVSHDFMEYFVEQILDGKSIKDIKSSDRFYYVYGKDETVNNILNNYEKILSIIHPPGQNAQNTMSLLEYIESYVELNYFDTNISEQGEQLYLYMNSRGEGLSHQEDIKSEIIRKLGTTEKKKNASIEWENWQNFFWNKRDFTQDRKQEKRENADVGFQEFLKWATIVHICTIDSPIVKKLIVNKKEQTQREAIENYIKRYDKDGDREEKEKAQCLLLLDYQRSTDSFKYDFLKGLYDSLRRLCLDNTTPRRFGFEPVWLANGLTRALDYVIICPLLYFVNNKSNAEERDIQRLGMFLKNLTYFESKLGKNPDTATIYSLELIKRLGENDITSLAGTQYDEKYDDILTPCEIKKLKILEAHNSDRPGLVGRAQIEEFIWKITNDEDISKFLEGDILIILDCAVKEGYDLSCISHEAMDCLESYYKILKEIIYPHRNDDLLRRAILTYGDYALPTKDGKSGSSHYGPWLQRFSFIEQDEWPTAFKNAKSRNIFASFMVAFKKEHNDQALDIYMEELYRLYPKDDWCKVFIKYPDVLRYCGQKKILWKDENRILLLSGFNAGSAIEIQVKLFEILFKNGLYTFKVKDYKTLEISLNTSNKDSDGYVLDVVYDNSTWKYSLRSADEAEFENKFELFTESVWPRSEKKVVRSKDNGVLCPYDTSKSIIENVAEAKNRLEGLLEDLRSVLARE